MNRDPDRSGQAGALTVLTPIAPGAEPDLRAYLESLRAGPSPLARLPGTHFGRWVIVGDLVAEDERKPDHLAGPHLLFTASFDGPLDTYLDELCKELAAEAKEIWGRCAGAPQLLFRPFFSLFSLPRAPRTPAGLPALLPRPPRPLAYLVSPLSLPRPRRGTVCLLLGLLFLRVREQAHQR